MQSPLYHTNAQQDASGAHGRDTPVLIVCSLVEVIRKLMPEGQGQRRPDRGKKQMQTRVGENTYGMRSGLV